MNGKREEEQKGKRGIEGKGMIRGTEEGRRRERDEVARGRK